jgi:hypothetical protein
MNTSSSLLITSYGLRFSHYPLFDPLLFRGTNPHAEFGRLHPYSQILIFFSPYYPITLLPDHFFIRYSSVRGTNTSASSPKFHALWNLGEDGKGSFLRRSEERLPAVLRPYPLVSNQKSTHQTVRKNWTRRSAENAEKSVFCHSFTDNQHSSALSRVLLPKCQLARNTKLLNKTIRKP